MTRYYFHIRNADLITPDDEGIELSGMIAARIEARLSAHDLATAAMRGGLSVNGGAIEVADERGNVLDVVSLRSSLN